MFSKLINATVLGIRLPDEFDEKRRQRLTDATPPDDLLHGESHSVPSSEDRSPVLEMDNADVLKGFEDGDPVQPIARGTDPRDEVLKRVADQRSSLQIFEGSGVLKRILRSA